MYELQVKNAKGEWDAYPDPLRETREEAEAKRAYCEQYEEKHDMERKEYRIVKLDQEGIKRHNEEWLRWVNTLD